MTSIPVSIFYSPFRFARCLITGFLLLFVSLAMAEKPAEPVLRFSAVSDVEMPDTTDFEFSYKDGSHKVIYHVKNAALLTEKDLKEAFTFEKAGQYVISITFNDEGKDKFAQVTQSLIGKRLAIIIQGKLITTPIINDRIPGGKAEISGNFTKDAAEQVVKELSAHLKKD